MNSIQSKLLSRVRLLVERGERISEEDCTALFEVKNVTSLAGIARIPRERRFGKSTFYFSTASLNEDRDATEPALSNVATMNYSSFEKAGACAAQLAAIRAEQDLTDRFVQFSPVANHDSAAEAYLAAPTATQTLRMIAVSRIFLDNVPHIAVAPALVTPEVAYVALNYGADTIDTIASMPLSQPESTEAGTHELVVLDENKLAIAQTHAEIRERLIEARWDPIEVNVHVLENSSSMAGTPR